MKAEGRPMPELKSTYIGELMMEITGSYMLGESPVGKRRPKSCSASPGASGCREAHRAMLRRITPSDCEISKRLRKFCPSRPCLLPSGVTATLKPDTLRPSASTT